MKSNVFRHLSDNVTSKKVSVSCFMLKKKMPIKLDPDLPTVSSNNKSDVPAKKIKLLGSFAYKASFKKVWAVRGVFSSKNWHI